MSHNSTSTVLHSKPHSFYNKDISLSPQHTINESHECNWWKWGIVGEILIFKMNTIKRGEKAERKEDELQAEIKMMTGSPHQYTATALCHPWHKTGLGHPTGPEVARDGAARPRQKKNKKNQNPTSNTTKKLKQNNVWKKQISQIERWMFVYHVNKKGPKWKHCQQHDHTRRVVWAPPFHLFSTTVNISNEAAFTHQRPNRWAEFTQSDCQNENQWQRQKPS